MAGHRPACPSPCRDREARSGFLSRGHGSLSVPGPPFVAVTCTTGARSRRAPPGRTAERLRRFPWTPSDEAPMRKLLMASVATAALGAAPVAEVRAQTAQDALGR